MREFFSLEGPFNKYGGMVADMIILSFMWLFFSIIGLGLTIGASTSALFFVTTRRIANREGYVTRDFWEAFKSNLKRATILWVIILALGWLIWFNLSNMEAVGGMSVIILPAQIVLLIEIAIMSVYAFPMAARFDMSVKQIIKTSFFMANRHLLTSISCVVLLLAAVLSFHLMPPLALFLAPGLYATLASYMIMRIFKRYRPEMDKDPVLEIQEIEAQKAEERRKRDIGHIESGDGDLAGAAYGEINETKGTKETEEETDIWAKMAQNEQTTSKPEDIDNEPDEEVSILKKEIPRFTPPPEEESAGLPKNEDDFWASIEQEDDTQ